MLNFLQWLVLLEQFDPLAYSKLFDDQLEKVLPTLTDSAQRSRIGQWLGFGWTEYIAAALRNAGFRHQNDLEEKIHDITIKLLVSPGGLFRDYDERRHGPLDLRFKRSVGNAVRNIVEKEHNRRKYLHSVRIGSEFVPGGVRAEDLPARPQADDDTALIQRFRKLIRDRLGRLALAVFDARLNGEEMKDLVGRPDLGSPGRYQVKQIVQKIKSLAGEFAQASGDAAFLHDVERLMAAEMATIQKRQTTTRQRQVAATTGSGNLESWN
jgi:hypothetical protein